MAYLEFDVSLNNQIPQVQKLLMAQSDEILDAMGKTGLRVARSRVPVDTGRLKSTIDYVKMGKGVKLIADTEYAAIIEFGGINRPPQPYMRPAALAMQLEMKQQVSKLAGRLSSEYS